MWKPVLGYEGIYEVSDMGNVRSLDRVIHTVTGVSRMKPGRTLAGGVNSRGYMTVTLCDGTRKQGSNHVLVAQAFLTNPHNARVVNHIDHNKLNNRASNLEYCSVGANIHHSIVFRENTARLLDRAFELIDRGISRDIVYTMLT